MTRCSNPIPGDGKKAMLPLAANVTGNLMTYFGADDNIDKVSYDRVSPETISLARERDAASREASRARLSTSRTARGLGLSAGATTSADIAAQAGISDRLGARVGKSFTQEEMTNMQSRQRADQFNAQVGMREDEANLRQEDMAQYTKDQAIQNIIQGSSQYFRDVQIA